LHFVLPFAAFVLLGVSYRRSIVLAAFGVLPDFDVLFHIHRSFSHSAVVLLVLAAPIMVWAWVARRRTVLVLAAAATFAVMSHLLLDLFTGFTPLFWPIYDRCLAVAVGSSIHVGSTPMFTYRLALESESMCITHLDAGCSNGYQRRLCDFGLSAWSSSSEGPGGVPPPAWKEAHCKESGVLGHIQVQT
jgi:membrane-bound metal-dependent hydrolase YbcI (DUF457 family)